MTAPLSIEISSGAVAVTVRVVGDIDLDTKGEVEDALTQLGQHPRDLQLDIRGVSFVDSAGLNMLLRMHHLCARSGGALTVVGPSEPVRRLIEISGLNAVLTIIG